MPPDRTRRVQIDSPRKNRFVGAVQSGVSQAKAARQENIPPSTASDIWKNYVATGTPHYTPRPGRPPALSDQGKRSIVRNAVKARRAPLRDLAIQAAENVSEETIRRALDDCDYHRCLARHVPYLTHAHWKARLCWARLHRMFLEQDWHKIGWSDEAYIHLGDNRGRVYVQVKNYTQTV